MTAQQRSLVGLGEGVNKAGVVRGWWANEVEGIRDGAVSKRMEAVYSMAMEGDGLWSLSGTQVSPPIPMKTITHSSLVRSTCTRYDILQGILRIL